jgi:uncharacterized RDD family membrane protein YckC
MDVLPGQHLLEESGVVVPIRPVTNDDDDTEPARLASLGDRFLALALDCVLLFAACALIDVWAFMRWGIVAGAELRVTAATALVGGALNLLLAFVYFWILEAAFGSTVGKAMIGIGVVNNSGRAALAASAIRNLWRVVDGIGFYLIGALVASCSKFRRRVGDLCAGTYVIEGNLSDLTRAAAVLGWLALLTGGAWAGPHLCARPKPTEAPKHFSQVVFELGRSDKSVYIKGPNHRVELSMTSGTVEASAQSAPDREKASKLDDQDSLRALP